MKEPALIVFDCDGTLVDSQGTIIRAMEDTFVRHRLTPPSPRTTRRVVGLSLVEAMQALLPEAEPSLHSTLAQDYKNAFHRLRGDGQVNEPLFEGTRDIIVSLETQGQVLGVATGKSDRGLKLCLEHHNLAHHFTTLQTADRHPSKPHPSMLHTAMADTGILPERTVMVGDTVFDIEMAVAAGVMPIGVAWGYHEHHELMSAGAQVVIDRFDQLHDVLRALA